MMGTFLRFFKEAACSDYTHLAGVFSPHKKSKLEVARSKNGAGVLKRHVLIYDRYMDVTIDKMRFLM